MKDVRALWESGIRNVGIKDQEIKNIVPDPVKRVRTTGSSTYSHPFQVTLPSPRTLSHKSSFIP